MELSQQSEVAEQVTPRRHRAVFVGTGPGDPDLLTLAAVARIGRADVILMARDLLRGVIDHPLVQVKDTAVVETMEDLETPEARAARICDHVAAGARVVRLVEGDPFLDGNIATEAACCVRAGVDFEVVPGVSTLTAVPEYAGIALEDTAGISFVNAMEGNFTPEAAERWRDAGTLVVSTRNRHVQAFVDAALAAGRDPEEPVVVTFRGGSTDQASKQAPLGTLAKVAAAARMPEREHVHIMLGTVARTADELSWFESKPLFGWRVLLPKTKDNTAAMRERLHGYGANSEEVPTICVERPRSPQQMDRAIRGLVEGRHQWVVFTSENAVKAVREKFDEYGLDARAFSGLRVAAASQGTAAALQAWGIEPDLLPRGGQTAEDLADEFPAFDEALDPINRVFLPRADIATEGLAAALTELGWEVEDVTAYRTVRAAPPPVETRESIKAGRFDAVVFTSASTVRNLVGIAGKPHHSTIIAAIGPATAKTCEEHGMRVDVIAAQPTLEDVVDGLAMYAANRRASLVEAGQPVHKPSQRRPGSRRRA